jgi:hypothetical protein
MRKEYRKFLDVGGIGSTTVLLYLLVNIGKASICHSERIKTKREDREVALIAVLANKV